MDLQILTLINFIDNLLSSVNWIQSIKVSSHYANWVVALPCFKDN